MSFATPHEAIVSVLRASAIPKVTWGDRANPFYQLVNPPFPVMPYVVFQIGKSRIEHTMIDISTPPDSTTKPANYNETYPISVTVVCLEPDVRSVMSPYATTSVLFFLDNYRDRPEALNGLFQCTQFIRTGWELLQDEFGPSGARVFRGTAEYEMITSFD